ncbi:hypothetical protein [Ralstonia sp. GP101]|uniref:hypothetical protein n=1 Tax=Ralstonia sp. GP101 TaxID=3035146 RepID=UPI00389288DC
MVGSDTSSVDQIPLRKAVSIAPIFDCVAMAPDFEAILGLGLALAVGIGNAQLAAPHAPAAA